MDEHEICKNCRFVVKVGDLYECTNIHTRNLLQTKTDKLVVALKFGCINWAPNSWFPRWMNRFDRT